MGLNDSYDHVKNQILLMQPFPSVNKAYSMVLSIGKQREVNNMTNSEFNTVMNVKTHKCQVEKGGSKNQYPQSKKKSNKKEDRFCTYFNTIGHVKETCFKLNGYPEWLSEYKQKKEKEKIGTAAQVFETPLDFEGEGSLKNDNLNPGLSSYIQQEIMKFRKN
ncbi:hypothetical protein P3X46_008896 [Hevea brasiliensis]|uniref:Uncharacterized protein n=1 Tax=Hevea brasiliensis TaxID=3981 RepID=A0ABQ9MP86_HEVBR|nr:hypothetical protein P3X46_008896 [Hevea brasiliensis]